MRPAHKLLKRLLRYRVWEIDWSEIATGILRADLLLRPGSGAEDVPLHIASTNPLTWLAWTEGYLDAEEVTPYVSPRVCAVLGLPPEERRFFMRHCRAALARLCGRRAVDKALLAALGAVPHHERLARHRAGRTPQDARGAGPVVCAPQPARVPAPRRMGLLDFALALQNEPLRACLRSEPFTWLHPPDHLLN